MPILQQSDSKFTSKTNFFDNNKNSFITATVLCHCKLHPFEREI